MIKKMYTLFMLWKYEKEFWVFNLSSIRVDRPTTLTFIVLL